MAKQAIEQTSLIPRSIIRTFDRFQKQLLPGAEKRVIQEFRISRYQVLVSIKCLVSLTVIPLMINYLLKNFLLIPVTEAFWNRQQNEIFLNSYQQNRAFDQIKNFEEKIYFEFLINDLPFKDTISNTQSISKCSENTSVVLSASDKFNKVEQTVVLPNTVRTKGQVEQGSPCLNAVLSPVTVNKPLNFPFQENLYQYGMSFNNISNFKIESSKTRILENFSPRKNLMLCPAVLPDTLRTKPTLLNLGKNDTKLEKPSSIQTRNALLEEEQSLLENQIASFNLPILKEENFFFFKNAIFDQTNFVLEKNLENKKNNLFSKAYSDKTSPMSESHLAFSDKESFPFQMERLESNNYSYWLASQKEKGAKASIKNPNLEKSLITTQLISSENFIQEEIQEKIIELAIYYNQESIKALTNLFGDFITFGVISFLGIWMKPQIIILKSFITESIYSLSDTTKSFLLILGTDLLVGFHSPRGWEIFLELFLRHFGFPENQDFIDLFVATFPVLLDTVFKYWIFRYLNQISPSTVATYHSMIE